MKHDTVYNHAITLGTALRRVENPIDKEVNNAAHAWIDGYLVSKGIVTTLLREKYTCYDISSLVYTIFTAEYMVTMRDTRAPL